MTDPEAYRRYARAGDRMAAEPDSEIYAFAAVGSICRGYNLLLERAALERRASRRWSCVHQEVEIADPGFCAQDAARVRGSRRGRRGRRRARPACARSPGGRARSAAAPVMQRYQEFGGGEHARLLVQGARPGAGGGGDGRRLPDGAVALGGAQPPLRRVAHGSATATTSTSACRCASAGRRVVTATCTVVHHHADRSS